jgi:hypothetical protein
MKKEIKDLKEDIVSFETAKLAKEKGFLFRGRTNDWLNTTLPYHEDGTRNLNLCYKGETYGAPTQSLLQKWLREKHHIQVEVNYRKFSVKGSDGYFYMAGTTKYWTMDNYFGETLFKGYDTYEQALEAGLRAGLNLIKTSKKKNTEELFNCGGKETTQKRLLERVKELKHK